MGSKAMNKETLLNVARALGMVASSKDTTKQLIAKIELRVNQSRKKRRSKSKSLKLKAANLTAKLTSAVPQVPAGIVQKKPSSRGGNGLFATTKIAKGNVVAILYGKYVRRKDFEKRVNEEPNREYQGYCVGNKYVVDPGLWDRPLKDGRPQEWYLMNHSKRYKNVKAYRVPDLPILVFRTVRDVPAGQELLYDYDPEDKTPADWIDDDPPYRWFDETRAASRRNRAPR
jgi:hypothetical protein